MPSSAKAAASLPGAGSSAPYMAKTCSPVHDSPVWTACDTLCTVRPSIESALNDRGPSTYPASNTVLPSRVCSAATLAGILPWAETTCTSYPVPSDSTMRMYPSLQSQLAE